jgi:hypothetical protein
MTAGMIPHLEPGDKETLINTASRRQQAINTRRDTQIRQQITQAEHFDMRLETQTNKWMDQNAAGIAALIDKPVDESGTRLSSDMLRKVIEGAVERREINSKHIMDLEGKLNRDFKDDRTRLHGMIRDAFKTTGPLAEPDPVNEEYIVRLQREGEERLRKGERPDPIFNDVYDRERKTPKSPKAYPTPSLLQGDKEDLSALKEAASNTASALELYNKHIQEGKSAAEARKLGGIDPVTAKRELRNIRQLIDAVNHRNKEMEDARNRSKANK